MTTCRSPCRSIVVSLLVLHVCNIRLSFNDSERRLDCDNEVAQREEEDYPFTGELIDGLLLEGAVINIFTPTVDQIDCCHVEVAAVVKNPLLTLQVPVLASPTKSQLLQL